jgi:hypothetical protein
MEEKSDYKQMLCKCGGIITPLYNQKTKQFGLYCDDCQKSWKLEAKFPPYKEKTIEIPDGIILYEGEDEQ